MHRRVFRLRSCNNSRRPKAIHHRLTLQKRRSSMRKRKRPIKSQIENYEKRLREMPLPVLKKRSFISDMNGVVRLEVDKFRSKKGPQFGSNAIRLIQKLIVETGARICDHRMIDDDPVPDSIRYQVLKRDRHCKACGATPEDDPLHVDHIIPRSKGGVTQWRSMRPKQLPD
jgi:HNH endonuclease